MPPFQKLIRADCSLFPPSEEELEIYATAMVHVVQTDSLSGEVVAANRDTQALGVVSSRVTSEMIEQLPDLRVISRFGSGVDNIGIEAASQRHILVTNIPDFCLSEVADHTIALLLAAARRLLVLDAATRSGNWCARVSERMRRIEGKQLGLVGLGRIAQEVAKRARPFGLRLVAYDPYAGAETFNSACATPMTLESLLTTSDFVSLHVPLTTSTRHLIGAPELRKMKPDAILINTARGAVLDESALVEALSTGRLGGAALDVYEGLDMFGPGPVAPDHALFHFPNVLLTPHAAACSEEALAYLMRTGARQAVEVLQGVWPSFCVNDSALSAHPLRPHSGGAASYA